MSIYLKIALYGTAIMLLAVFISNAHDNLQGTTIQDINTAYKANPTYGNALGSPGGSDNEDHTLYIAGYEVPFIGDGLYFITVLLGLIWTVLSTLIGFLADIALLSTKFPSFLTPIVAIGQCIVLLSWYKVLLPTTSG